MSKLLDRARAVERFSKQGQAYAVIQNPKGVFPPEEIVPLAATQISTDELTAIVCDMDGTLTTTEGLCLHSLETMVRRWMSPQAARSWNGLDPQKDYPHVIGNSTTRHVEYLMETYGAELDDHQFCMAFVQAACWLNRYGQDLALREEIGRLAVRGGLELAEFCTEHNNPQDLAARVRLPGSNSRISWAVMIYYHRYHEILRGLENGHKLIPGAQREKLIAPMPAVGLFLALVKGWVPPADSQALAPLWLAALEQDGQKGDRDLAEKHLVALALRFEEKPLLTGLVTSSVAYEMDIVLKTVFKAIQKEVLEWPVSEELKEKLHTAFGDYRQVLDVQVNASATSEGRLKPHRDLYSMALQRLGIPADGFDRVLGFEDSESGTIAMRAAGIGMAMAVPFQDTANHDLSAAAKVLPGGLAQAVLQEGLFLREPEEKA